MNENKDENKDENEYKQKNENEKENEKQKEKSYTWLWIILIIVFILVCFLIVFFTRKKIINEFVPESGETNDIKEKKEKKGKLILIYFYTSIGAISFCSLIIYYLVYAGFFKKGFAENILNDLFFSGDKNKLEPKYHVILEEKGFLNHFHAKNKGEKYLKIISNDKNDIIDNKLLLNKLLII